MFTALKKLFNFDPSEKAIKFATPIVTEILTKEAEYANLSLDEMKGKVDAMRAELKPLLEEVPAERKVALETVRQGELPDYEVAIQNKIKSFVPELFALLREVNNRKFHKPHFEVQLLAATILAQGNYLTELKTGEGKTQVFHLPAALYGITGRGSHVVTVNDYLARRDGEHAGHALSDLGITVGVITPQAAYKFVPDSELTKVKGEDAAKERMELNVSKMSDMHGVNLVECSKHEAYMQDVVYGTNNEFGFDYLRDNMATALNDRVQRELYFCIVDEADSILIDESRTPLIISAPSENASDLYQQFAKLVKKLNPDTHYVLDEKSRSVTLTEEGVAFAEKFLNVDNIWEDYKLAHHLDNALKAEVLYKIDDEYIIRNGEVLIVDEFTGRVLPGRRYSEGLHQAIEAKEGVDIKRGSKTLATITFQNFFRLYKTLSGGSGTIMTESEEFIKIYNLESVQIPTNKTVIREDKIDKIYKNKAAKFKAAVEEIITIHETGAPVLVGTTSIEDSETVSKMLDVRGIEHEVLNAKFHEREAAIVAKAGEKDAITVATNMAGRGTDIPLAAGIDKVGGLHIIGTERHEARRVDNQLRGRAGRQGEPGKTQFFVALDDEIMRIQGGEVVAKLMAGAPDETALESSIIMRSIESAQKRMEGHNFDIRKRLVEYDTVMNQQREIFYTKRYNLLRLVEKTQSDNNETAAEAKAEITSELQQMLTEEVESIVAKHVLAAGEDGAEISKMLSEFLGLAPDTQIYATYNKLFDKEASSVTDLVNDLKDEQYEVLLDKLNQVISEIFAAKQVELATNLPEIYKALSLQTMDQLWTEHLELMSDLREGISLQSYAQRNPLVEYKNQGFVMFENLMASLNSQIAGRLLKVQRVSRAQAKQLQTNESDVSNINTGSREMTTKAEDLLKARPMRTFTNSPEAAAPKHTAKVSGRNDLCPCGSGLKYKKCGLINSPKHKE